MRAVRLIARRSRARSSLLLSLFSVTAIAVFLLAGMVGYLAGTADTAARAALSRGAATSVAVQLSTRLAPDSESQADAVGQLIEEAFGGLDFSVHRTVRSNPAEAFAGNQAAGSVILTANRTLDQRAELVSGAWSDAAARGAASMQATAAEALGIDLGDEITVDEARFVLAATWLPIDPTSPYWFADPAVASGFDGISVGPVVIAEAALAELPVRSYAHWTVVPTGSSLTADALPRLAAALDELSDSAERADGNQNIELAGTLADRVDAVQRSIGVAGALAAVPVVLVALIALIAVGQLARLLASVRRTEAALQRARGASATQLTAVALVEMAVVIVPGGAIGWAVVAVLLNAGFVPLNSTAMAAAGWPVALLAVTAALLVSVVVCWHAARVMPDAAHGDSGRARSTVTMGGTVLILVAAAISMWQFKLYGSPLVAAPDGGLRVDPLAVAAPALTLLALAALGVVAFAPAARLLERWAALGRGILPVLPGRQVARRVTIFGVALLLITLSVSGTTLAAAYSQTGAVASAASARLGNGADVRVQLSPPLTVEGPASLLTSVPYLRLPGVNDAATVLKTTARIADDSAGLTAMAASRMPAVIASVEGSVDPARLAATLQPESAGLPVNAGELSLILRVGDHSGRAAGKIEAFSWLEDANGSLARVSHGVTTVAAALAGPVTLNAALPEDRVGDWSLLAVEAGLTAADGSPGVGITIQGLGRELELTMSSVDPTDRAITYPEPKNLPVVVTEELASRLSLETSSPLTLRIPATASSVDAVVVGSTPDIPASRNRLGLIADLPTLNRYLLATSERIPQPGEVWINGTADAALIENAVTVSRSAATVTTAADAPAGRLAQPAIVALWWGAAGSLLLAAIALLAITSAFTQDRREEVVVLRALGMTSAEQGKNRLVEVVTVAGAGLVVGIVCGLITAALTANELASAGDQAGPAPLRFDMFGWLVLVFALVAAIVTISTGYAGKVADQAKDTEYRGESR